MSLRPKEGSFPASRLLQADRMASPRPALVISRRAGRTTPVDTRGWMGGVSRRAILSIKPETFLRRAVSETSLKAPRSLSQVREGLHTGRGFVKVHMAPSAEVDRLLTIRWQRR